MGMLIWFLQMAKKAVESSIDAIREMVKDGRIKE
jgi:hypothetical protein